MSSSGSVSQWIGQIKDGDESAAQRLWERYFQRLVKLARARLQHIPRRAMDEEDVALSAFDSFCRRAKDSRFPQLSDRNDLWRLLVVITARKALHLVVRERRQKRIGGAADVSGGADVRPAPVELSLEQIIGREPTPDFAAQVAEECQRLLARVGDTELSSLAVWKMEGYTNEEIAAKLGCALCTVERKLRVIRSLWAQEITP